MHVTPGLQEYKLCTEQPQKKSLKSQELRCEFILLIEVRRRLVPYSKFSCTSVKKCSHLIYCMKVKAIYILFLSFVSSNLRLARSIDGSMKGANPYKI